jgi:hypothetical protein
MNLSNPLYHERIEKFIKDFKAIQNITDEIHEKKGNVNLVNLFNQVEKYLILIMEKVIAYQDALEGLHYKLTKADFIVYQNKDIILLEKQLEKKKKEDEKKE